jgi:hypothetical protein
MGGNASKTNNKEKRKVNCEYGISNVREMTVGSWSHVICRWKYYWESELSVVVDSKWKQEYVKVRIWPARGSVTGRRVVRILKLFIPCILNHYFSPAYQLYVFAICDTTVTFLRRISA